MTTERAQELLRAYADNTISALEREELFHFLKDPANEELFVDALTQINTSMERVDLDESYLSILDTVYQVDKPAHRIHFLKRTWFRYAAAIILLLGAGAYLWTIHNRTDQALVKDDKQLRVDVKPGGERAILTLADGRTIALDSAANGQLGNQSGVKVLKTGNGQLAYDLRDLNSREVMWNTVSTPKGGQYRVTLPDGTGVWLNASSSITFPIAFVGNERPVKITGEVYFEIAKNKQQPFVVDVDGKSKVQVLGTSFNVNSYGDDGNIMTTLLEGSVKVIRGATAAVADDPSQSVVLKPGQQAVLKNTPGIVVVDHPDIAQTLAWKNGIFDFTGADLKSVMKQLERWYDITVQYKDGVPKITFDGKMYRDGNFSGVLEMLTTMGVQFRMEGKTLIIL